jgi:hypothetical protein
MQEAEQAFADVDKKKRMPGGQGIVFPISLSLRI